MDIKEFIKTRITPFPQFRLRFETVDGKKLVVLDVFAGEETPYYYAADGVMEAYTRIGNQSVLVDATEHKRLVLRGKKTSYDFQSSGYKLEDFSFSQLRARYKKVTGKSFEDKIFESFGIVDKEGVLTYAGALLADESPIRYSRVFCRRWNGLIHRDYLITGSEVHVDMFDDRLEIVSPGGMVEGKPVQEYDIDHIPSMRRNPVLADIFSRLDYMERSGSGLSKIRDAQMNSANYVPDRQPVFYSDRSQFIITIPNLNYKNEMIKSILAENDRDQVTGQVIGQVTGQVIGQVAGQVTGQVTDQDMGQVIGQVTWRDLAEYCKLPRTRAEMQDFCGLSGRANFRENHLRLLLEKGVVKMTIPDKPNSRNQRYYSE